MTAHRIQEPRHAISFDQDCPEVQHAHHRRCRLAVVAAMPMLAVSAACSAAPEADAGTSDNKLFSAKARADFPKANLDIEVACAAQSQKQIADGVTARATKG